MFSRSLVLLLFAGFLTSCVPYQTVEELSFKYNQQNKSFNDLRDRYNTLLSRVGRGGGGDLEGLQRELDRSARTIADLEERLSQIPKPIFVPGDEKMVIFSELGKEGQLILGDLLFESGSADIRQKGRAAIDGLAQLLKSKYGGETFHIVGHTDNVPISRSGFKSNLDLGVSRAHMVFKYLHQEHAFPESQFFISSYGAMKPKAPNTTPENKAKNRRVEISRVGSKF